MRFSLLRAPEHVALACVKTAILYLAMALVTAGTALVMYVWRASTGILIVGGIVTGALLHQLATSDDDT